MSAKPLYDTKEEEQLMAAIWSPEVRDDPYKFVMFAFPWGKENTPLAGIKGPRKWQEKKLKKLAAVIAENRRRHSQGITPEMLRDATASGRGIGKSAYVAMITLWFMSCVLGGTVIVTANTEQQLTSRTWPELGKWATMAINSHWFDYTATKLRPAPWFEEALKRDLKIDTGYYYAQAQLWSEDNPDAFAGAHNMAGILVIFDEASGIPKPIYTVTEGFFTEPVVHRYWAVFSNPRRTTGPFFECFHKDRNYWDLTQIDSRTVEGTDSTIYRQIIEKYGEDSDEARVEVRGQFPRQGDSQFISREAVDAAVARTVTADSGAPLMMGVDVARFGDDKSVICFRQGRDARSIPWKEYKGMDTHQLGARVAELADKYQPDCICVDGGGVGGGVVDYLKARGYRVHEVQSGTRADRPEDYANKRTEMWAEMRAWLLVGAIPMDPELMDDLLGPEYKYRGDGSVMALEPKDAMKKRGLASPNKADALGLTLATRVARKDMAGRRRPARMANDVDYKILG